jgi:hypothetical protein
VVGVFSDAPSASGASFYFLANGDLRRIMTRMFEY